MFAAVAFGVGFVVGGVVVGLVVLNNQKKALAVLQAGKEAAEKELAKLKR
jgi:uncharacterized membrane protein YciS (DUF1049 family)